MRQWTRDVVQLYYDMQEVWLGTRGRPRWQQNVAQLRKKYEEMSEAGGRAVQRGSRFVRHGGRVVQSGGRIVQHGSRFAIRLDPFRLRVRTRADLNEYWRQTRLKLRRGRVFRINPARVAFNLARDARLCIRFNLELLAAPSR